MEEQIQTMVGDSSESHDRLLAQAVLLSTHAGDDLQHARNAKLEAERLREQAETESIEAMDNMLRDLRAQAQAIMQEAEQARAEAIDDRDKARKELSSAEDAKEEADRTLKGIEAEARDQASQIVEEARRKSKEIEYKAQRGVDQLEAEAKSRAENLLRDAIQEADDQVTDTRRRASEEVRKIMEGVTTVRSAAQEELEAQRLLTATARIRAQTPGLRARAQQEINDMRAGRDWSGGGSLLEQLGINHPSNGTTRSTKKVTKRN